MSPLTDLIFKLNQVWQIFHAVRICCTHQAFPFVPVSRLGIPVIWGSVTVWYTTQGHLNGIFQKSPPPQLPPAQGCAPAVSPSSSAATGKSNRNSHITLKPCQHWPRSPNAVVALTFFQQKANLLANSHVPIDSRAFLKKRKKISQYPFPLQN